MLPLLNSSKFLIALTSSLLEPFLLIKATLLDKGVPSLLYKIISISVGLPKSNSTNSSLVLVLEGSPKSNGLGARAVLGRTSYLIYISNTSRDPPSTNSITIASRDNFSSFYPIANSLISLISTIRVASNSVLRLLY